MEDLYDVDPAGYQRIPKETLRINKMNSDIMMLDTKGFPPPPTTGKKFS